MLGNRKKKLDGWNTCHDGSHISSMHILVSGNFPVGWQSWPSFFSRACANDFYVDAVADVPPPNTGKQLSEEETRDLIARQRNALYGEGGGYIDENGQARTGAPGPSEPPSLRGASPLGYDNSNADVGTPGSGMEPTSGLGDPSPRPPSTSSPQTGGPANKVFEGIQSRTSTSSPTGGSPPHDLAPGSKPSQTGATVAPIGTRPSGTPTNAQSSKRSTPPVGSSGGSSGGWGRGGGVWGQSSGLGTQASVWG